MTIKTKLIANVLVTAIIIIAISMASFLSMRFLQEKLLYLTEKSTPFQIRTIGLQREMQRSITALVKVNAAKDMAEYELLETEAERSLYNIEDAERSLEKMKSGTPAMSDELEKIALELFAATGDRIRSSTAAAAANAKISQSMKESSFRLNEMDVSIRNMQHAYSRSFSTALENTGVYTLKLRAIEDLRNIIRELQLLNLTVQDIHSGTSALIAKAKLKAIAGRIEKNGYYNSSRSISTLTNGVIDMLAENIKRTSVIQAQKDGDSRLKGVVSANDLPEKLNSLFQTLDQETMLVRDELNLAYRKQENIFAQSSLANSILLATSELVAQGLMITGEANRLFTIDSLDDLEAVDLDIRSLFTTANVRVQMLESSLVNLSADEELMMLRAATQSLAAINTELYSANGIVSDLKKKLYAIKSANSAADKLHSLVMKQSILGNERVSDAQNEQEKSIIAVNRMVRSSLSQISGFGTVAIVIGIVFGFWIYRSVLLPLRIVLAAVHSQKEKVEEKAAIAETIAGGDLTREVTISEAIVHDPETINNDEMGILLNEVVGMSKAQVKLDRSFAGMTESLRSSRDAKARRDRLKSGLYELNNILRDGHKTAELGDKALAYIADFLGSGVGVIYLYDDKEEILQTLSTFAISRSGRLNEGFRSGEGLAGQVAQERKMICLNAIPPDYLPITSALGEAEPLNIVIMPIMHNETLVGVLELGSFKQYNEDDFEFLNQSLIGIAIAINVNRSHQLVNELLEHSQAQAEELKVQQEELQQSNEELVERARMLVEQRNLNIY